jgi:hypothetical protein
MKPSPVMAMLASGYVAGLIRSLLRGGQPVVELHVAGVLACVPAALLYGGCRLAARWSRACADSPPPLAAAPACTLWLFALLPPRSSDFWANGGTEDGVLIYPPLAVVAALLAMPLGSSRLRRPAIGLAWLVSIVAAQLALAPLLIDGFGADSLAHRARVLAGMVGALALVQWLSLGLHKPSPR